MLRKTIHSLLAILAFALLLGGCQPAPSRTSGLPRVLAIESFLGDLAQNVAGSRLKVDVLLPVTVDPHEYQPRPQDVSRLAQSQVIIVNGLGYETWLQKTLAGLDGQHSLIVATQGLTPAPVPAGESLPSDPHLWMDPLLAVGYVNAIRDGLDQADPAGKTVYDQNAAAYILQLQALDGWVKDQVATLPVERRLLVTDHDALGYFAWAYDFKIVGAIVPSVTTEASPSAQQLAGLVDTIKSSHAPAIFLNVGQNRQLAEQLASETGVKVVTDLYVESLSASNGPAPTYIELIKHDVTVIVNALK